VQKVSLANKFAQFSDHWSPKVVGAVDDYEIKLVKVEGTFTWHKHDDEDEMFLVVGGNLTIKLRDQDIELDEGEFFVVPKGVEHCPHARREAQILVFERRGVINTGDVRDARTVLQPESM
jgi:mannose-6-phosphate isomerase-like protein (cupin superfamily)